VSSIRLFILGALDERGPMHGHQLRHLAEEEHVHLWTDVTVGALYGAMKRVAAEGLIEEIRSEKSGAYPERQIFAITETGRAALARIRFGTLSEIVMKPDPFDLAMTRLDRDRLDEVQPLLNARLATLRDMVAQNESHTESIRRYLTFGEYIVMQHRTERLRAEVTWHEHLLANLPQILTDESFRKDEALDAHTA
jgi:DNA-binding PadR family transcriptional regulator